MNTLTEKQIQELYATYQAADGQATSSHAARRDAGLALGKALYDLRAQAEVVSGGTTFDSTLKTLGVPHRTAYRWIKKYELSVGIRRSVEMTVGDNKKTIHGLYYDGPTSIRDKKFAARLCADAHRMADALPPAYKALHIVQEGCKDRDQLELLVRDLERAKRSLDTCLPVLKAVLSATPTAKDRVHEAARRAALAEDSEQPRIQ